MLVKSTSVLLLMTGRCVVQSKLIATPMTWSYTNLMQQRYIQSTKVQPPSVAFSVEAEHLHANKVCKKGCVTCKRGLNNVATVVKDEHGTNIKTNENGNVLDAKIQDNLQKMREGRFLESEITDPEELQHFRHPEPMNESDIVQDRLNQEASAPEVPKPMGAAALPHPIWSNQEVHSVQITHKNPEGLVDRMAFSSVKFLRNSYDAFSGFNRKERNEAMWLNRLAFLETVAGVPGMVAAMVRHLHSLRKLRRDHGWIHTLLEEAENERMHLMTVLQLKKPSWLFRMTVLFTQGVFVNGFSLAYLLSPRFCHRFVGYLEEEAVITYSKLLKDIESGPMQHWNTTPAPPVAIRYWHLMPDATMKDVMLAIRADEAHHRVVNHTLSSMKPQDYNPYVK